MKKEIRGYFFLSSLYILEMVKFMKHCNIHNRALVFSWSFNIFERDHVWWVEASFMDVEPWRINEEIRPLMSSYNHCHNLQDTCIIHVGQYLLTMLIFWMRGHISHLEVMPCILRPHPCPLSIRIIVQIPRPFISSLDQCQGDKIDM